MPGWLTQAHCWATSPLSRPESEISRHLPLVTLWYSTKVPTQNPHIAELTVKQSHSNANLRSALWRLQRACPDAIHVTGPHTIELAATIPSIGPQWT